MHNYESQPLPISDLGENNIAGIVRSLEAFDRGSNSSVYLYGGVLIIHRYHNVTPLQVKKYDLATKEAKRLLEGDWEVNGHNIAVFIPQILKIIDVVEDRDGSPGLTPYTLVTKIDGTPGYKLHNQEEREANVLCNLLNARLKYESSFSGQSITKLNTIKISPDQFAVTDICLNVNHLN